MSIQNVSTNRRKRQRGPSFHYAQKVTYPNQKLSYFIILGILKGKVVSFCLNRQE